MSRGYTPRRCSKRWLDGDCPAGVLAILEYPHETERYDIFYADVITAPYGNATEHWLSFVSSSESGSHYHGEMQAHQVAAYRDRMKHRYTKWSTLPQAVKNVVLHDLQEEK